MSVQEWHVVFKDFNYVDYNNFEVMTAGQSRNMTPSVKLFSGNGKV